MLHDRNYKSRNETQAYSGNFWQGYLFLVPFFVTKSILKEIESKELKRRNLLQKDYEGLIRSWKLAANDLNIKIQAPFILKKNDGKVLLFSMLIERFGSTSGTIIFSKNEKLDFDIPKKYGYHCVSLHPLAFSTYNKELFIDTLNTWGFFGDTSEKPNWYKSAFSTD
jgi:hypothetical protein